MAQVEKDQLIHNQYGVLLAVNGIDLSGLTLKEVTAMIMKFRNDPATESKKIKLTFLHRELFNRLSDVGSVFKG
jgi:hypothetical protein